MLFEGISNLLGDARARLTDLTPTFFKIVVRFVARFGIYYPRTEMSGRDDETLLNEFVKRKSNEAFAELARRHGPVVYGTCLRLLGRVDLAEDAAQAVFLILARKAPHLRVRTTLVPWCLATAKRVCHGIRRAERRRIHFERPLDETLTAPPESDDIALFEALDRLRDPEQEAVVLRFVQGLSLAEIGKAQGISEDAARMRVQRAVARLRERFAPTLSLSPSLLTRLANPESATASIQALTAKPMLSLFSLSGGVVAASAVVVSVAVAQHRPAPKPDVSAPVATTKPPERVEVPNLKGLIPVSQRKIPTLDRPFTLVYDVTFENVATPAMRASETAAYRARLTKDYDADRITRDEMESRVAKFRDGMDKVRHDQITLSYDGHTLLIESENPERQTMLIADGHTMDIHLNGQGMSASPQNGVFICMGPPPLIGISLPYVPMTRGDKLIDPLAYPRTGFTGDGLSYFGVCGVEGGEKVPVKRLIAYDAKTKRVTDFWSFSDHRKFGDAWVAGTATHIDFDFYPTPIDLVAFEKVRDKTPLLPKRRTTYRMVSISPTALPTERFVPEAYLDETSFVAVHPSPDTMAWKPYVPGQGTILQQIAAYEGKPR